MPKGIKLHTELSKDNFIKLYQQEKSLEGISRVTGYDPQSLRNLMRKYDIPFRNKTKYSHNNHAFSMETEESFYWAGFIAADGCIKEKGISTKILSVSLAKKDKHHLFKLKQFLSAEEPVSSYNDNSSEFHVVSKDIAKDLLKFNITPRKSKTYIFPEIIKNHKLVRHFMRGYFDGDGGLSFYTDIKRGRKIAQAHISIRGTYEFLEIFREKLINLSMRENKITLSNGTYLLAYSGNNNAQKMFQYLYNNSCIYLDRKYELVKPYINYNEYRVCDFIS